jgi:predicted RNA-binding protein associated with RNAse of E/G family
MFSEKERDYHAYQARQNSLRVQRIREDEMEEALREKQAAIEPEHAALQEIERLKALLENQKK